MKTKFLKSKVLLLVVVLFSLAGCTVRPVELKLSTVGNIEEVEVGKTIQFQTNISGEITYHIIENGDAATISTSGLLQVNNTAIVGTKIKVVARYLTEESNVITLTVISPLTLVLSSDKTTAVPGEDVNFTTNMSGAVLRIVEGLDKAQLDTSTGVLTINDTTTPGTKITVIAQFDNLLSNEVTVTVTDIPLTEITLTASVYEVTPGESVELIVDLTPSNTTQDDIEFIIDNGYSDALISGNVLTVDATASLGNIEIIAKYHNTASGDIVSNKITIKVVAPSDLYVNYNYPNNLPYFLVENNGTGSEFVISVNVTTALGKPYNNATVDFTVVSGSSYISITKTEGYNCYIELLGHGDALVKAVVSENTPAVYINVKAVKTPDLIELSEYLDGKVSGTYQVAIDQPFTFMGIVSDQTACQELEYQFKNLVTGEEGDLVGFFDKLTNKITLIQTGLIEVSVKSLSGNQNGEIVQTYVFNANDGINVHTWEQLKSAAQNPNNEGRAINIVVTEKLPGYHSFDIVPLGIIDNSFDLNDVLNGAGASIFIRNSLTINGNSHPINFKNLPKFNMEGASAVAFEAIFDVRFASNTTGNITFNDIVLEGNVTLDGTTRDGKGDLFAVRDASGKLAGVHRYAIAIGENWYPSSGDNPARYLVTLNNVQINYFHSGLRINRALENSSVNGAVIDNCYVNGVDVGGSVINFHNTNFGNFGGASIDLNESGSNFAGSGYGENVPQKVTFSGTLVSNNQNNLQTRFLREYSFNSVGVSTALQGVVAGLQSTIMSELAAFPLDNATKQAMINEIMTNLYVIEDGKTVFNLFAFKFNGLDASYNLIENRSQMEFNNNMSVIHIEQHLLNVKNNLLPVYMGGGDVFALMRDTTHQFIAFSIPFTLPSGNVEIAQIVVVNPNYGKSA